MHKNNRSTVSLRQHTISQHCSQLESLSMSELKHRRTVVKTAESTE